MGHTSTASILFCDLVGSTERFAALGDDAADGFIAEFLGVCRSVVEEHNGSVVKTLGDGLMGAFEHRTLDAVQAACDLHARTAALDVADPPQLRVGISVGEVSWGGTDWYGRPVIEAARLCSIAPPGETLVSDLVRGLVGSRGTVRFVPVGPRELRGLPGEVVAFRVEAAIDTPPPSDPQVELPDAPTPTTRRPSRLVGAAAALVAAALLALAASVGGGGETFGAGRAAPASTARPRFESRPCAVDDPDPTRTCGVLHVPLDRTEPSGKWIEIPLDSWRSTGETDGSQVALEIGSVVDENQAPTRLIGRTIRLGVRGREGTPLLNCPEVTKAGASHLLDPLYSEPAVSAHLAALRACRARWTEAGYDVAHFNTADIADDVRDAIAALGLGRIDLIAGTDQSPAALSLLRDESKLLRSATLVNPEAPNMSSGQLVLSFRAAFQQFAELCRADPRCDQVLPDPLERWRQVYDHYQAQPSFQTGAFAGGAPSQIAIDGDRGASALEVAVGSVPLLPYLPFILTGDAAAAAAGNAYEKSDTSDAVPTGADLSDICHRIRPNDALIDGDWLERYPEYRSGRFRLVAESCAAWSVPSAPIRFRSAVASSVPTFIVVGSLSTATNPQAVDNIVAGLENVSVMQFPTLGFAPMYTGPSCLLAEWRQWLEDPATSLAPAEAAACVASAPPVPFLDHL